MKKRVSSFDIAVTVLVLIITVIIAYPLYFCIIASFSDIHAVVRGETLLWIKDFTTEAYEYVFKEKELWIGYRNTIFYTLFGTIYNLVLTLPVSYAMTKKNMPFRNALSWYFFITMYLSGGMIPTYMLYKNLGLINNPLARIFHFLFLHRCAIQILGLTFLNNYKGLQRWFPTIQKLTRSEYICLVPVWVDTGYGNWR